MGNSSARICMGNSNVRAAVVHCKGHRYANPQVSSKVKLVGRARGAAACFLVPTQWLKNFVWVRHYLT